jgi:hypothetical protein
MGWNAIIVWNSSKIALLLFVLVSRSWAHCQEKTEWLYGSVSESDEAFVHHGFSIKSQVNYWPLPENLNLTSFHYGADLTAYYVYLETIGVGAYVSQNKISSLKENHSLLAVGGEIEVSFKWLTKDFYLTPIMLYRLGYNKERFINSNSQQSTSSYSYREGINYFVHGGLRSNFKRTNRFQFGLTIGMAVYTAKPLKIFYTGEIGSFQCGMHCVFMLGN